MGYFSCHFIEEKSIGNQRRSVRGIIASRQGCLFATHQGTNCEFWLVHGFGWCQFFTFFDQTLPANSYEQMAEMSVMMGRSNEAETILLHNNKISEAVELCIRMHRWERALEIAKSNDKQSDVDSVLEQRKKYLNALNRPEYLDVFLKYHWIVRWKGMMQIRIEFLMARDNRFMQYIFSADSLGYRQRTQDVVGVCTISKWQRQR